MERKSARRDDALIMAIAQRFKQLRDEKGVSQRIANWDTDINVADIETGRRNISITTISDLCKYYDTTLEEFFRGISK